MQGGPHKPIALLKFLCSFSSACLLGEITEVLPSITD